MEIDPDGEELRVLEGAPDTAIGPPPSRYRLTVVALVFAGLMQVYALRVLLSVAIIPIAAKYHYNEATVGWILSAFFIGYISPQILGGWAADRFGAHRLFARSILISSLLTALTPPVVASVPLFMTMRVLTGLFEAVCYPCVIALASAWSPVEHRASFIAVSFSGGFLGTACAQPLCGALISVFGWQSVFYVFGACGVGWTVAWYVLASSSPETHPGISREERLYIVASRGIKTTQHKVPWRAVASSPAVWAIIVAHTCHNWAFYTLLAWMPSYLHHQLQFDVAHAGVVAFLPYLACFLCSNVAGRVGDHLVQHNTLSIITIRKLMALTSEVVPALCLIIVGFIRDDALAVVCLLTVAVGASGCCVGGWASNHLDIAPHLAGMLYGVTNTFGTLPGIIGPIVIGHMVASPHNDEGHWQGAFFLSSGITLVGFVVFVGFARGAKVPELTMM